MGSKLVQTFCRMIWFSIIFQSVNSQLTFKPKDGSWTPQGKRSSDAVALDVKMVEYDDTSRESPTQFHVDQWRDFVIRRLESTCRQLKHLETLLILEATRGKFRISGSNVDGTDEDHIHDSGSERILPEKPKGEPHLNRFRNEPMGHD